MADLVEIAQWEEGVYQLETSDPVMGGPDGVDNRQAKQLANRTRYLRAQQEAHAGADNPHPQYATLVAMQAAIAALVNSSPATLDTLKELADALGDDPDFATTVTNALALKAALDSPFFTGTPRGPTPAQFDNSTKLVTTAFLSQFGLQYSPLHSGQATVASTTMDNSYIGSRVVFNNTANQAATLPPIAGLPNGASLHCSKVSTSSSGIVTISAAGADQIDSGTGLVTSVALNPGEDCVFTVLSGAWVISGSFLFRRNAFSQSLANNGYAKLPSGLIVQWGTSTIATQSMQTVTLPVAYPNAFILAAGNTGTVITPNAASISLGFQGNGSKTSFNVIAGTASSGSTGISWISIGY
ncbi:gp53-like domain-containing protein [Paraburkholderia terricola]|uniref:gp53-like domain-containing protein n=1 Tax=Paraburkholderia terricola TaxID=169427 RepID=UPI001FD48820|nr:hypothetical protein [Paraburkholderia terricola]